MIAISIIQCILYLFVIPFCMGITFTKHFDEKYNIDGYYFADACWDNDLEHDKYLHVALTPKELSNTSISPLMMNASDLLDIDSVGELLKKMYILSHGDMTTAPWDRETLREYRNPAPP